MPAIFFKNTNKNMHTADELAKMVDAQGAKVRDIKAQKADKALIKAEVDELLRLKALLAEATGASSSSTSTAAAAAAAGAPAEPQLEGQASDSVTPFEVNGGDDGQIDYTRLMKDFGTQAIDEKIMARLEALAAKKGIRLHTFLRRGLFFSHRSLNEILDAHDRGEPFYLYTGRGPSSESLHFGHLMPFMFTKFLQELFDVPLVIQLTNDEKYLWKDNSLEDLERMMVANAKDIVAVGFDPRKTFIFANTEYMGYLYPTVLRIQKALPANQIRGALGLTLDDNIGKWGFTAIQAAPSFPSAFPLIFGTDKAKLQKIRCLIPCAIDQDPFFRLTRFIAHKLGFCQPAVIHSKFFPALQGSGTKMSASSAVSAIYVDDSDKLIKEKINKHAFSGGKDTIEEHRKYGGNCDVDVSYQYLCVFLDDDAELERIRVAYTKGEMLSGELKKILIDLLQKMVKEHQERKAKVTDAVLRQFMDARKLEAFDY